MPERDLVQPVDVAMRFDALDAAAQGCKRAHACAVHASPLLEVVGRRGSEENQKLAHLFMICSNIKLTGPAESIGIAALPIHEGNQVDTRQVRSSPKCISSPSPMKPTL